MSRADGKEEPIRKFKNFNNITSVDMVGTCGEDGKKVIRESMDNSGKGRPRSRWLDQAEDLQKLKVQSWRELTMNREK